MGKQRVMWLAAVAAGLAGSGLSQAALVNDWRADTYTSGGNWTDSTSSAVATQNNSPTAVSNAFFGTSGGFHKGVQLNGTNQYFSVPAASNTAPGGQASYTLAAVFRPTATGATGGNFWQSSGLIGMEEGGVVNDFGLGWGGTGTQVLGGEGVSGGADHTVTSGALTTNQTHAAVLQVNAATGTATLYVDGAQVAQDTGLGTPGNRNADAYSLGAITSGGGNPFPGVVAELQTYNDATVSGTALSQSLLATYTPEPTSLGLLAVGGLGLLARRRRRAGGA